MAIAFFACAKTEEENLRRMEQEAFEAWVLKHVNGGVDGSVAVRQPNGMYVEFLTDGDQNIESSSDKELWLELDFTSRDKDGNVFVTRSEEEALRQRTFTPYTHYVPVFVFSNNKGTGIPSGQHYVLKNRLTKSDGTTIKLSKGSAVKMYMPSYMAYGEDGYSDDQGYGGQYPLTSTKIVVDQIEVKDVVENPLDREEKLVVARAAEWSLGETDTIAPLFFVDSVKFEPKAEVLAKYPEETFVKKYAIDNGTNTKIRFVGKFLDGFIFDTNIESVYNEFYGRRSDYPAKKVSAFNALSYTPSRDKERFISAFHTLIPKLRCAKWYRVVFTSAYGYGATGLSADLMERQEYHNSYASYMNNAMYYNAMYGNSYYNNYYDNYYYDGMFDYYNSSASSSISGEVITEIQSYTPLYFEIYIEEPEEEETK
jgi:hypothetical protein